MKQRVAVALGLALLVGFAFVVGRCTAGGASEQPTSSTEGEASYTCAMHVHVESEEPGECPICGMELVPRSSVASASGDPSRVVLSERSAALARIRTVTVREAPGAGSLRLLGRVEVDESSEAVVTAWVAGRIDRLHVRETGQRIRRGQRVATVYSPEVYAAHQELLVAARQLERLAGASELARAGARATLDAARTRLALLGLSTRELDAMAAESTPRRQVSIRAPFSGTVLTREATVGAYVGVGAPLYRIARLDTLWAQLEVFEADLARVTVGAPITLRVVGRSGEPIEGRVAFVDPRVDPVSRSARVRVEIDGEDLRPGLEVEGLLALSATPTLTVPATAPLFTGRRSLVYVEVPSEARPTYEARVVRLGPRADSGYPVLAGLSAGERVVLEGAFVLDADLQIQGGDSALTRAAESELEEPTRAALAAVLGAGLDVAERLADDDHAGAVEAAAHLERAAAHVPDALDGWAAIEVDLAAAGAMSRSPDLDAARVPFERLGAALTHLVERYGNVTDAPLRRARCPMAFENRGAEWLQRGDVIANPYFGAQMRTCGSIQARATPGGPLVSGGAR